MWTRARSSNEAPSASSDARSRRRKPGAHVGVGVVAEDGDPVRLDALDRRLHLVADEALERGLRSRDMRAPLEELLFAAGVDLGREQRRHHAPPTRIGGVEVDVDVAADERPDRLDQLLVLRRADPRGGAGLVAEAVDEHPVLIEARRRRGEVVVDVAIGVLDRAVEAAETSRRRPLAGRRHAHLDDHQLGRARRGDEVPGRPRSLRHGSSMGGSRAGLGVDSHGLRGR